MEDAGGEHGVGLALDDALGEVLELAHAAAGNDGDVHGPGHGARQVAVEAVAAAVAVHGGEQDLPRPAPGRLAGPFDGVDMGVLATAGHVDLPLVGIAGHRFRVDGAEDRLRAEGPGRLGDELGVGHGCRVHRHLVGAGGDHLADVGHAAEAAAHAIGQMQLGRGVARELHRGGAIVAGGGDVQEDDLVGLLLVVGAGQLDGVARIAQPHEVHALHDAAVLYVQAGDYSLC